MKLNIPLFVFLIVAVLYMQIIYYSYVKKSKEASRKKKD